MTKCQARDETKKCHEFENNDDKNLKSYIRKVSSRHE